MMGTSSHRGGTLRRSAAGGLILLVGWGQPLTPAEIVVDNGCSLADAIESANTDAAIGECVAGDGPDTIRLTESVEISSALPAVTATVTFEGANFEIRRDETAPDFRILEFKGGINSRLENVTISNGRSDRGGGVYHNAQSLTLVNVTMTNNVALSRGGALYSGWDTIDTRLVGSTVSGNTSGLSGGGIFVGDYGDLTLTASTISGNVAGTWGGGIAGGTYTSMTLINSTISENIAEDGEGGAIYKAYGYQDIVLRNSSVINNSASATTGGIYYDTFGPTDLIVSNSIVAANSGLNCQYMTPVNLGGNFDDDGSCGFATALPGVDFDLALVDNGGPTKTHRLLRDSVAIDAGVDCEQPLDQRGFLRDLPCDSGSTEFGKAPAGGSIEGLAGRDVSCKNLDTGFSSSFALGGADSWSCRGLGVELGDRVEQSVSARVVDGAAGSIIGLTGRSVFCANLTTGDGVNFPIVATSAWDCEAAGLVVNPGDRVRIEFSGQDP